MLPPALHRSTQARRVVWPRWGLHEVTAEGSDFEGSKGGGGLNQDQICSQGQEELRFQLAKRTYDMWLKNTSVVSADGGTFRIGVPSKLAKDWLEDRFSGLIQETLQAVTGAEVDIDFVIAPSEHRPAHAMFDGDVAEVAGMVQDHHRGLPARGGQGRAVGLDARPYRERGDPGRMDPRDQLGQRRSGDLDGPCLEHVDDVRRERPGQPAERGLVGGQDDPQVRAEPQGVLHRVKAVDQHDPGLAGDLPPLPLRRRGRDHGTPSAAASSSRNIRSAGLTGVRPPSPNARTAAHTVLAMSNSQRRYAAASGAGVRSASSQPAARHSASTPATRAGGSVSSSAPGRSSSGSA